ncbi:MAG: Uncharacterised protein [Owenweeksia sp. TMED14]|nr:MAG: Uncharacterised protein [Owenweeksia sp. TMED14]
MEIKENFKEVIHNLPDNVTLVAVSKTKPDELIEEVYKLGHRDFGENKVQDLKGKAERLPKDINWHMIGQIQTNKIKDFISFVHLVHGVDRIKVLEHLNKEASKIGRVVDALIQVHIAKEDSKSGFSFEEASQVMTSENLKLYPNVRIRGLMGMASFTDNQNHIKEEFSKLKQLFNQYQKKIGLSQFDTLSMGMSGDCKVAIREGSTMIRIGTALFGKRNY